MEEHQTTMTREKETKNTIRFKADPNEQTPIKTVYVEKWFANGADEIVLTVSK